MFYSLDSASPGTSPKHTPLASAPSVFSFSSFFSLLHPQLGYAEILSLLLFWLLGWEIEHGDGGKRETSMVFKVLAWVFCIFFNQGIPLYSGKEKEPLLQTQWLQGIGEFKFFRDIYLDSHVPTHNAPPWHWHEAPLLSWLSPEPYLPSSCHQAGPLLAHFAFSWSLITGAWHFLSSTNQWHSTIATQFHCLHRMISLISLTNRDIALDSAFPSTGLPLSLPLVKVLTVVLW